MKNRRFRNRIGVTTNIFSRQDRDEWVEAIDRQLVVLLSEHGYETFPILSSQQNIADLAKELGLKGFILSGGNNLAEILERDELERQILEYSIQHKTPILGICRGMQMMNVFCRGGLEVVSGHVRTSHCLTSDIPELNGESVNSFHSFGINDGLLGDRLVPIAYSDNGSIEIIRHLDYRWLGVMGHPERPNFSRVVLNWVFQELNWMNV